MRQLLKSATVGLLSLGACSLSVLPANGATISWEGTQGYSMTGDFDFNNLNGDDFARTADSEITQFNVTFSDTSNNTLITYDLATLDTFFPEFNFNYQISTGQVLQSGDAGDPNGFRIGDNNAGVILDTTQGSGISFVDNEFGSTPGFGFGGTLEATDEATAVPFEAEGTIGLVFLGSFLWYRNRKKRKKALSQETNT